MFFYQSQLFFVSINFWKNYAKFHVHTFKSTSNSATGFLSEFSAQRFLNGRI